MLTFSLFFSVVTSNLVVFAFSLFFSSVISNLVVFFQALESQSIRYAVFHSVYNYWKKKVAPSILWWNQFFSFPRILSSGWDQKLFPIPSNVACFSLQFRLILFSVYSTFTFCMLFTNPYIFYDLIFLSARTMAETDSTTLAGEVHLLLLASLVLSWIYFSSCNWSTILTSSNFPW